MDAIVKPIAVAPCTSDVHTVWEGEFIKIPRVEWGVGMGHKQINGDLMPGGRLRMEKLAKLVTYGKLNLCKLITLRFEGFDKIEDALMLMKDKPKDLIKPVVRIEK